MHVRHTVSRRIFAAPPGLQVWLVWDQDVETLEDAVKVFNVLLFASVDRSASELAEVEFWNRDGQTKSRIEARYLDEADTLEGVLALDYVPVYVFVQADCENWYEVGGNAFWTQEAAINHVKEYRRHGADPSRPTEA